MRFELKNLLRIICLILPVLVITFSAEGIIDSLNSYDIDDITDDDEVYHAGQSIKLIVDVSQEKTVLDSTIQIISQTTGYNSGIQKLEDAGDGSYIYLWNTDGLREAEDYTVNAKLKGVNDTIIDVRRLTITIDNTSPSNLSVLIKNDQPTTSIRSVFLSLSAQEAVEMFVEGDVVDDTNTHEWIPYVEELFVNLTEGDGQKEVKVQFRDAARNESDTVTDTIVLDRDVPKAITVVIEEDEIYTATQSVVLTLEAENALQMFIRGDVVNDTSTFEWIPYTTKKEITLTSEDGEKTVKVKFRNSAKLESDFLEDKIILDSTPPAVSLFESHDADNPEDSDNYYHAGQLIKIRLGTEEKEEIKGNIRIKSERGNYDSGLQKLTEEGDGSYSYLWNTKGLKEARDYVVEAKLIDRLERQVNVKPITLTIDNTPPVGRITVNNNELRTISRSVELKADFPEAVEMYMGGDIVEDTNTFEWIPYTSDEIIVNLTGEAGEKQIIAKFRDKANNESQEIKTTIILITTSPMVEKIDSWDESNTSDNDEYYHAGQTIVITVIGNQAWLLGTVRIKSKGSDYDSGLQDTVDEGDGRYTYLWDTTSLSDGEYLVNAVLSDGISDRFSEKSLTITIDNIPPSVPSVEIKGDKTRTASTSVNLNLSDAEGVKEIYIDGEVIDDTNTFEWISFVPELTVNLSGEDAEKQFAVKYRDAALNESKKREKTIVLDTTGPGGDIIINEDAEYTTEEIVSLNLESEEAVEMYISGDINPESEFQNSFEWIPYVTSAEVHLTEGDSTKTVKVAFRDDLGNIGEEAEDTITLDTIPPQIKSVQSRSLANEEDDDERYYIGNTIKITPELAAEDEESEISGTLRIKSKTASYDSGLQRLTEDESGQLIFLWETSHFQQAEDYRVELSLSDAAGNKTVDNSLTLALISPFSEYITINGDDEYTKTESVEIQAFSDSASEMLIEGDVKDNSNTFEWIEYAEAISVELMGTDGEKSVKVTFRDKMQRESIPVEDSIILDTEAPKISSVKSYDATEELDNDGKYHAGETVKLTVEAVNDETGLKGTIRIYSVKVDYDSGVQKLKDDDNGEYSYLWDTSGLKESDDYVVEARLEDLVSHETVDTSLAITIDNTPPLNSTFEIQNSELEIIEISPTRSVILTVSAEDSIRMWIEGDVVDDTNTFQWIPYESELVVNLTHGDAEKTIRVKHKDSADNESSGTESTVVLNEYPPEIRSVDSADKNNSEDSDEIYHAGQSVIILIESTENETDLEAMVQIKSEDSDYDSGIKLASDNGDNSYSYLWDTSDLKSASDYVVKAVLQDSLGQKTVDESLTITIDNEPPSDYQLRITNHELGITNERSIVVEISSAEETTEMFIEGDVVEDEDTFKWIPLLETKEIQLTEDDGEKTVKVKFRDEALNESLYAEDSIILDTTAPENPLITINQGETETDSRLVTLNLFAEDASEMYIDGNLTEEENEEWIPYESLKKVELTEGDGKKLVGVKYRDKAGNESPRVEANIILDQPGPTSPSIVISDFVSEIETEKEEEYTSSSKVSLALSSEGATEMYIDGDVVTDESTFRWITYQPELQVNLIKNDGQKTVRARFRNGAGNESEQVEATIILDQTAPVIDTVESYDVENPSDDDDIYHPGQKILIKAITEDSETDLNGSIRISSEEVKYDSSLQKLTDEGDGSYTYLWQTTGLQDSKEYKAEITLEDKVGLTAVDDSMEIVIDSTVPVEPKVTVEDSEDTFQTRSVNLNLTGEDTEDVFIEGDVINDMNTFEWIPFTSEMIVNLSGRDGEKNISVKFRDAAQNESESIEVTVMLELKRPELLKDVKLIQPDGLEIAYLVLPFDEPIENINKDDFYVQLSNPDKPEEQLDLDAVETEPVIDKNKQASGFSQVIVKLKEEHVQSLRSWKTVDGERLSEVWIQIAENSVFDLAGNGNLSNDDQVSGNAMPVAEFTQPSLLQQAVVTPTEFSPNDDGIRDEVAVLYILSTNSDVTIKVKDWRNHLIYKSEKVSQPKDIQHQFNWDGKKEDGSDSPDGTYTINIEVSNTLTGIPMVAKSLGVILDTVPPQITDKKPIPGQKIPSTPEITVEAVENEENQAASGIDENNVYITFDQNEQQVALLTKVPNTENKYRIPSGNIILQSGKHTITFHVADKAGNYTEETEEYTIVNTSVSPVLEIKNYPNPFSPGGSTTIQYVLSEYIKSANIYIYDASGNLVLLKEFKDDKLEPGEHRIYWDGRDLFGNLLTRGVYFCEFRFVSLNPENTIKKIHKIAVW